jgi:hypothetical protein
MPGLVPGIHDFLIGTSVSKTWMAGTSPAMTAGHGTVRLFSFYS